MYCPVCGNKNTSVVDSRMASDGMSVRRRRECEKVKCGYRFSTSEEVELLDVSVVKRDSRREGYSREKMLRGIKTSLEKRPYTEAQFRTLLQQIERDIQKKRSGEITSREIGEIVMNHLKKFDKVAYIRFASVYHAFEDPAKFAEELNNVSGKKRKKK